MWMKRISKKILHDTDSLARTLFRQGVHEGRRVKTHDLKKMNTAWRKDYFSEIMKYDEQMSHFIQKKHAEVVKEHIANL